MRTVAISIGALAIVAVAAAAIALVADPKPIDAGAAVMISFGLMTTGLTALSGLLLARAPWGRWGMAALVVLSMGLATVSDSPITWLALVLGTAALVGLLGPWLRLWTRHRPAVEAPGPVPIALMAVAPVAPLVVGLTAVEGISWAHWLAVLVAAAGSMLYAQGAGAGMWVLRVGVPIAGLLAIRETGGWGFFALAAVTLAVSVMAWLPAASRTTTVITPPLPSPVPRKPR